MLYILPVVVVGKWWTVKCSHTKCSTLQVRQLSVHCVTICCHMLETEVMW
jgi:hypothetical protein